MANKDGKGGKSAINLYTKGHAYRYKEQEVRAEEDRIPVVCTLFLIGRGRGDC